MPRLPPLQAALAFLSLTCLFSFASTAKAGWLASGSLGWGVFSFRPLAVESTPNYFAYGASALLGYSLRQRLDIGLQAGYQPGHVGAAHLGKAQASLINYGLQAALRLREKVYLGLRAGLGQYHLVKASGHPLEVSGAWAGPGGGLSVGSIFRIDRRNYWQITLDLSHYVLVNEDSAKNAQNTPAKRRLDALMLSATYTFNAFANDMVRDSLFENVF